MSNASEWVEQHVRCFGASTAFRLSAEQSRCVDVISSIASGPHNVHLTGGWEGVDYSFPNQILVKLKAGLGTTDGSELTRLVLAAHQHHVRVHISPRSASSLDVWLHARDAPTRPGDSISQHPGLEELGLTIHNRIIQLATKAMQKERDRKA